MDAVFEIRKIFADYPFLLELGKQLRAVKGKDKIEMFSIGMSSKTRSIWLIHPLYQLLNISYKFPSKTLPTLHHAPEPARTPNGSRQARPIGNLAFLPSEDFISFPAIFNLPDTSPTLR
ncbi:hypothetical protein TNCT_528961 [Trichonephila clavata]|uniref:Uncharacterized protein n=1 Tax=Trichonephila clavata TaxID=2740835 RepID=A0A8X6H922_TRICU|nr:hypothetical protein TNCT_528961 [Trichonephila clavata]